MSCLIVCLRFADPLYVRVDAGPEAAGLHADASVRLAPLAARTHKLNDDDRIDRDAVFALKTRGA
jgi:hypothetical protein